MARRYPSTWMWAEACELLEQAERLHRQFFELGRRRARQPTWEPPVDVFENDETLTISLALPGVPADRIELQAQPGVLRIVGERPVPRASRTAVVRRLEIPYGRFERVIELPEGRYEIGHQEIADGCLHIQLLKR